MRIEKDNLNDKIILTLSEEEFLAIRAAVSASTGDDKLRGEAYFNFYGQERGFMVKLFNELNSVR